jgi:hypothetical protein
MFSFEMDINVKRRDSCKRKSSDVYYNFANRSEG